MNQPTTKQELLHEMERAHQDMVRFLAALSDADKNAPVLNESWSVKDSLAHLVDWEKMMMGWLSQSLQGAQVKRFIPGFQYDTEAEREPVMEKLNTHLYEQSKNRALDDVMSDFRATYRALYDLVTQMSEADIFDPNRFAWRSGSPAFDTIAGNTFQHYDEHREWMAQAHAKS